MRITYKKLKSYIKNNPRNRVVDGDFVMDVDGDMKVGEIIFDEIVGSFTLDYGMSGDRNYSSFYTSYPNYEAGDDYDGYIIFSLSGKVELFREFLLKKYDYSLEFDEEGETDSTEDYKGGDIGTKGILKEFEEFGGIK